MKFFSGINSTACDNKKNNTLHNTAGSQPLNNTINDSTGKRTSFAIRASMTVEASLILPLFMFVILGFITVARVVGIELQVHEVLNQCAKIGAIEGEVKDNIPLFNIKIGGEKTQELVRSLNAFSYVYTQYRINAEIGDKNKDLITPVGNGLDSPIGGILVVPSHDDNNIKFDAYYRVKINFLPSFAKSLFIHQKVESKKWNGKKLEALNSDGEKLVYMTKNGSVYHTNRHCSYIEVQIKDVKTKTIDSMRNKSGAKYYECEVCGNVPTGDTVYITEYGTRYHNTRACSEISRNVIVKRLSEVGGMSECSKCRKG